MVELRWYTSAGKTVLQFRHKIITPVGDHWSIWQVVPTVVDNEEHS